MPTTMCLYFRGDGATRALDAFRRALGAEAETLGTISFGLFLARLAPKSHLSFEQTRVNGEIWLPKRATVTASARLALVKQVSLDQEITFSGYRKFQADSKIVSATELAK